MEFGHVDLWVEGRILFARIDGMWSKSMAQRFSAMFKKTAAPLIHEPWAHLALLQEWELGSPDIEPVIAELSEWCIQNHLTRAAQIYENSPIKEYQMDHMVPEVQGKFIRQHFFTEEEGRKWLEAEGFDLPSER